MNRRNESNPRHQTRTPPQTNVLHPPAPLLRGGVQFYRQAQPRRTGGAIIVPPPSYIFNFNHLPLSSTASPFSSSSLALSPTPIFYHQVCCQHLFFFRIKAGGVQ